MSTNNVLKILWFFLAIFCVVLGVKNWLNNGFENSYVFFILAVLAFMMFWFRHKKKLPLGRKKE